MNIIINIFSFLRYENWIKNLLIFIPFLLTNNYDLVELEKLFISFISFSFAASAGYIVNDLNDIEFDRNHILKKERPIASGKINKIVAYYGIFTLLLFSALLSIFFVNSNFLFSVMFYFLLSTIYTTFIKNKKYFDLFYLSSLYVMRIISGCLAINLVISPWLFAFSFTAFVTLASFKRLNEINFSRNGNDIKGYKFKSKKILNILAFIFSVISIFVLIIYFNSNSISAFFELEYSSYIYPLLVLFFYVRALFLFNSDLKSDDAIINLLKDRKIMVIVCLIIIFINIEILS